MKILYPDDAVHTGGAFFREEGEGSFGRQPDAFDVSVTVDYLS